MPETDKNDASGSEGNIKSAFGGSAPAAAAEFPPDVKQALADLLGSGRGENAAIQARRQMESYSSPLPHPKHLAEYQKYCSDFLPRSLAIVESAQEADIKNSSVKLQNERLALENERDKIQVQKQRDMLDSKDTKSAQYLGFLAFIFLIIAAVWLSFLGHDTVAGLMVGSAFVGIIGRLFIGKFYH